MATKKAAEKTVEKKKSKVSRVWSQARESLRLLETLEKETLARARTFVRNPLPRNRRRTTNDKILASVRDRACEAKARHAKFSPVSSCVATMAKL